VFQSPHDSIVWTPAIRFTARSFRTFCALVAGCVAQTGPRTVCGMLSGAGLSRVWAYDRVHRFFSVARCSPERVGLAPARLVMARESR